MTVRMARIWLGSLSKQNTNFSASFNCCDLVSSLMTLWMLEICLTNIHPVPLFYGSFVRSLSTRFIQENGSCVLLYTHFIVSCHRFALCDLLLCVFLATTVE